MGKLTVESLAKKIERENKKFDLATDAEKRVMIAKDCLARIELGQIEPNGSRFCKLINHKGNENIKNKLEITNDVVCQACAKGSLFMSYIGRVNNYNTYRDDIIDNSEHNREHSKLFEIFSPEQLTLIEYAFEGTQYIFENKIHFDKETFEKIVNLRLSVAKKNKIILDYDVYNMTHRIINYFDKDGVVCDDLRFKYSKVLLVEICKNIIKNKGTFVL